MISTKAKEEVSQLIQGRAGQLELLTAPPQEKARSPWGIVCHPHPLHGGTMHNKVVVTLVKAFRELGAATVRFNFRGVGQSQGQFDQGIGELDDLFSVIDWALQENPERDIWLAGFSFGAAIATIAATRIPVSKLVTVAPPVEHFSMKTLPPITCPWVLVQGDQDEVVPAETVYAWADNRDPKPQVLRFPNAGHFFHGELLALRLRVQEALGG